MSNKSKAVLRKSGRASFDPKNFLAKVGGGKIVLKCEKDEIVFLQGDVADAIFYIQKGKIKLTVVSDRGKEAVVGLLGADHFFGESCLNGHPLRITTATAIEECLVTRIARAAMIATLHDQPNFSELFMADLLSRNSRIEEDLIDQLFNSSEKRLARALLLLANFGKENGPAPIVGKFSQELLAEMIGTTRSRVSHFMNKFRQLGYIKYNGNLEIHNSLLNVVLYDKPEIRQERPASPGYRYGQAGPGWYGFGDSYYAPQYRPGGFGPLFGGSYYGSQGYNRPPPAYYQPRGY